MIVTDATVLIALAKLHLLRLLKEVYGDVLIGPIVKNEVVDRGKVVGAAEVVEVERALAEGSIRVIRPAPKERKAVQALLRMSRLDDGEAEAISIAQSHDCMVIIDDKEARTLAASMGIEYVGTAGVLLEAYASGHLSYEDLENAVRDLSKVLWLSPAVAVEVLRKAREMKR